MRYSGRIFILVFVLFCIFIAVPAQAAGNFVTIEYFMPVSFIPENAETTTLSFFVTKNSNITVRIFNFSGALVFEKKLGFFYEGKHEFIWDGFGSNEKLVAQGLYKCHIIASQYGYTESDNNYNYAVVLVRPPIHVANNFKKVIDDIKGFPIKITGFVRSITEADSQGVFNWDKKEIQIDLKNKNNSNWKYDLRFFPYQDPSVAFNWSDFVDAKAGYYKDNWNVGAGYHNFIPGYNDPLNLFQDYKMAPDRIDIFSNINSADNNGFNISGAAHRIMSLDQYAVQVKSSFKPASELTISGCSLNKFDDNNRNNVLSFWANYSGIKGTVMTLQIAGSSTDTNSVIPDSQIYGGAARVELGYGFPFINGKYGNFSALVALELVEKNFVCDFAELPNGNDNFGPELTLGYNKDFNIEWFRNLKVEAKKTYFRSLDSSIIRQKFQPTATAVFVEGLEFSGNYDYFGTEKVYGPDIEPTCRIRRAMGEIHFYRPKAGGWDSFLNYSTSKTQADSFTDYTSTKISAGYHFLNLCFPYLGCEKIISIAHDKFITDCYFWTIGANWVIIPKYRTKTTVQAGWVEDNMGENKDRLTYYADFQQYFFNRLSILVAYGSLTSIDPVPRFSMQVKYEF